MEKHFYIGEGAEADQLLAETRELWSVCREAQQRLAEDYGADSLVATRGIGWRNKVTGLFFAQKVDRPYLKYAYRVAGGYAYLPRKKTQEGKELARRLREEKSLHFSVSRHIVRALKVGRIVRGTSHLYESTAGYAGNSIFLAIPGSQEPCEGIDPFPAIPEWFREVRESEWLAGQGF